MAGSRKEYASQPRRTDVEKEHQMNAAATVRLSLALVLAMMLASCTPSGSAIRGDGSPPDPVMGDWQGHRVTRSGVVVPMAVHSIALGDGRYRFAAYIDMREPLSEMLFEGKIDGNRLIVSEHPDWSVTLDDGTVSGRTTQPEAQTFALRHVVRLSPNLGARPPEGALVLFDGSGFKGWERREEKQRAMPVGWKSMDGVMEVAPGAGDIVTKQKFTDFRLHLEFRTPFMPEAREQARGNSGVYLQGRYEVQVLDSYGLTGEDNECGGIYKVGAPRVNMCAPPGQWQSYDILFNAPRFEVDGKKVKDALVTVVHNGIVIHEDLPLPGPTGGALDTAVQFPGGILLQDHGNLVQYRNIWLVELKP